MMPSIKEGSGLKNTIPLLRRMREVMERDAFLINKLSGRGDPLPPKPKWRSPNMHLFRTEVH